MRVLELERMLSSVSVWAWDTKQSDMNYILTSTEMHIPERIYPLKEDNKMNDIGVTIVEKNNLFKVKKFPSHAHTRKYWYRQRKDHYFL